jgi:predicted glycoside hydrolase/deacetylase ChbG (UPF0249 family)
MLGYPDDARLLLVNADDLGMYESINDGVIAAYTNGLVRSTSLMMPCPGAPHALQLLALHPGLRLGVHLSVIRDIADYQWGPVAPKEQVPSLLDADGNLFHTDQMTTLMAQATIEDVETEFRAQIDAVLATDLTPTHLDWHCLYDGGRPDIFDLSVRLVHEYGLALRADSPATINRLQRQGFPTSDHPLLDSFSLELDTKAATYADMLRNLPVGLTHWAVHPSLASQASRTLDPDGWQVRRTDFDFLTSQSARDIIAAEGIILISHEPLQAVWRRLAASR